MNFNLQISFWKKKKCKRFIDSLASKLIKNIGYGPNVHTVKFNRNKYFSVKNF